MKKIIAVLCTIVFICTFFSGCQAISDQAASLLDSKCDETIEYFNEIALFSNISEYYSIVKRWERSINIRLAGDYTEEDYSIIRNFVDTLNDLNELPDIYFTDDIKTLYNKVPNFYIYFVPLDEMSSYEFLNNTGRLGSADLFCMGNGQIDNAYIGIASDVTSQKDRNNLILRNVTAGLGLMNASDKYPDSIFSGSMDIQSLSDMDYELIRLLYSDSVRLRMDKTQVDDAIKPLIKAKYLEEGYLK